jgi:hypothetical protein
VIWPGATRMMVGSVYPVPASVIPCPNSGAKPKRIEVAETTSTWHILHLLCLDESRLDGEDRRT